MGNEKYKINPLIKKSRPDQIVVVYKNGKHLDYTTKERARKLVENTGIAYWHSENEIILTGGRKKREKIKEELVKTHGRKCYICGNEVPEEEKVTLDHFVAKKNKGGDSKHNCKLCCMECNKAKKSYTMTEFLKLVAEDMDRKNRLYPQISRSRLAYLDRKYNRFTENSLENIRTGR